MLALRHSSGQVVVADEHFGVSSECGFIVSPRQDRLCWLSRGGQFKRHRSEFLQRYGLGLSDLQTSLMRPLFHTLLNEPTESEHYVPRWGMGSESQWNSSGTLCITVPFIRIPRT